MNGVFLGGKLQEISSVDTNFIKQEVNSLTSQHWTFKEVKEFCDNYKAKYPEITLTYSPIIIICRKI